MNHKEIWKIKLKNGIFGGLTPTVDPFDNTKFYVSDGIGSTYPSMKLRQLSFESGQELNTVSIKNSVRCIYFNSDGKDIFADSNNKIFQINRIDFSIIKKFEKGIQKYSDFISSNDKDTLLLMNSYSNFIFIYNYIEEKGKKKKLRTCKGIFKENNTTFLIFCPRIGSVQQLNLQTNKLKEILRTEIFKNAYKSKSDKFYFHLGKVIKATQNTHERITSTNQINIYSKSDLTEVIELKFDFNFENFIVSENEENLYLINDNKIWIYSLIKNQIINKIILSEKARTAQVFDKQQLFISYEYDKPNIITGWEIITTSNNGS